jgi:hypothetical protein
MSSISQTIPKLHRINGRIILLLFIPGAFTGMMLSPGAFGDDLACQTALGVIFLSTFISASMGYYYIRTGQIKEHRKWMFRELRSQISRVELICSYRTRLDGIFHVNSHFSARHGNCGATGQPKQPQYCRSQ